MPLGISENLLQRALAPVDLSIAYNAIQSNQQRLAAEDRRKREEAMKQYYTESATMGKEQKGIRAIDVPEASKMYSDWANVKKQLAVNPNLITRNPEMYGQLNSQADELEAQLMSHIQASKEIAKFEKELPAKFTHPSTMDFYKGTALEDFNRDVRNAKAADIMKNNAIDESRYFEPTIDGSEFDGKLNTNIQTQALGKTYKADNSFKGAPGEIRNIEFDKVPQIGALHDTVLSTLNSTVKKRKDKFAVQELSKISDAEYNDVKNRFIEHFSPKKPNEGILKYYDKNAVPSAPPDMFVKDASPTQMYVDYITAKKYLDKLPASGKTGKGEFGSESQKALFAASLKASGKESGDIGVTDVYGNIDNFMNKRAIGTPMPVSGLNVSESGIVMDYARKLVGDNKLSLRDIYLKKSPSGKISIYTYNPIVDATGKPYINRDTNIGDIPYVPTNIKGNAPLGQKGKVAASKIPKPSKGNDPLNLFQ